MDCCSLSKIYKYILSGCWLENKSYYRFIEITKLCHLKQRGGGGGGGGVRHKVWYFAIFATYHM